MRIIEHAPDWEQRHWTSRGIHRVDEVAGHPGTAVAAACLVLGWAMVGLAAGFPSWWQTVLYSVTGSVTFIMVFVIQHAQQRQTSGTQRKLDELIRSSGGADDALIAIEEAPDEALRELTHQHLEHRSRAGGTAAD